MTNHLDAIPVEELLADWGFFLAPLNNGDWMVGRKIYSMDVMSNHYLDAELSVHRDPREAIKAALARGLGKMLTVGNSDYDKRQAAQRAADRPDCLEFWRRYGFPAGVATRMVSEYTPDQYAKWAKVFPNPERFKSQFGCAEVTP